MHFTLHYHPHLHYVEHYVYIPSQSSSDEVRLFKEPVKDIRTDTWKQLGTGLHPLIIQIIRKQFLNLKKKQKRFLTN